MDHRLHRLLWRVASALAVITVSIWVSAYAKYAHVQTVAQLEPAWVAHVAQIPQDSADAASLSRTKVLLAQQPTVLALSARSKTDNCEVNGPLPDSACSPGAVFADASTSAICVAGYSSGVRSVSTTLKKKVYAEYGIAYPQPTGSYEVDHIVPLELGGSNDIANLFPEAAAPTPGFKEKDVVEDYLHDKVCAGNLNLVQAQEQIATNWLAVYQALDPSTISEIKQKYKSWAK